MSNLILGLFAIISFAIGMIIIFIISSFVAALFVKLVLMFLKMM